MRHRSSTNAVALAEPSWPTAVETSNANNTTLFQEELEATDEMAFNSSNMVKDGGKFGKEDEIDSLVSGHSLSQLQKKSNLEVVWQKANSINGIRRLNMMFKEERRAVVALDEDE